MTSQPDEIRSMADDVAEGICEEFRKRFKEDKGCSCDFISKALRTVSDRAYKKGYFDEKKDYKKMREIAWESGFSAAREQAAKKVENHWTQFEGDLELVSNIRAMTPDGDGGV